MKSTVEFLWEIIFKSQIVFKLEIATPNLVFGKENKTEKLQIYNSAKFFQVSNLNCLQI